MRFRRFVLSDSNLPDSTLYQLIRSPDFPTGGVIVDAAEAEAAYKSGHGSVSLRARARLETNSEKHKDSLDGTRSAGQKIVVFELPYGVNKVTATVVCVYCKNIALCLSGRSVTSSQNTTK